MILILIIIVNIMVIPNLNISPCNSKNQSRRSSCFRGLWAAIPSMAKSSSAERTIHVVRILVNTQDLKHMRLVNGTLLQLRRRWPPTVSVPEVDQGRRRADHNARKLLVNTWNFEENEAVVHGCAVSCVDVCRRDMYKHQLFYDHFSSKGAQNRHDIFSILGSPSPYYES